MIREGLLLLLVVSLLFTGGATASPDAGSNANSISASNTPLFDYRYNQVAEDLGLLKTGTSEGKLEYGSIEAATLNPLDTPPKKGCPLTIKQADIDTMGVCQWETEQTCFDSCGSTCSGTCGSTCGSTCGDTCSGTCLLSCRTCVLSCGADTCGSTCQDSCGGCGQTLSYTCGETCGNTCADTCTRTCSNTCANTCGQTCRGTCARTCSNTCANTCAQTCGYTCHNTCFATCQMTCARTCSATCGPYCAGAQAAVPLCPNAPPLAMSSTKAPLAAEQNSLRSYNIVAMPPTSVNYLGIYTPWTVFQQSFSGKDIYAWIETECGWDVIAKTPKGTWVREFVFVPANGNLISNEIAPDGKISSENFDQVIAGYKYIWIYAENPGSYISTFEKDGKKSNQVTLNVS